MSLRFKLVIAFILVGFLLPHPRWAAEAVDTDAQKTLAPSVVVNLVRSHDDSAVLVQLDESRTAYVYRYRGKTVFEVVLGKGNEHKLYLGDKLIAPSTFASFRDLHPPKIIYEEARIMARKAMKSFGGKLDERAVLQDAPIEPRRTNEHINRPPPTDHPYWVFSGQKTMSPGLFRGLDIYIDAVDGRTIFKQEYSLIS